MDAYRSPQIETIRHFDESVYERIVYPDGRVEMKIIPPPPYAVINPTGLDAQIWNRPITYWEGPYTKFRK